MHIFSLCALALLIALNTVSSSVTDPAINTIVTVDYIANVNNITQNVTQMIYAEHVSSELIQELTVLRRRLHQNAELAGQEKRTQAIIAEFMSKYNPDECMQNVGGGLLYLYRMGTAKHNRRTILFRADFDALPILESPKSPANNAEWNYMSQTPGVAHLCGHDGHSAIVSGMGSVLNSLRHKYMNSTEMNADVLLLFQPAEETGAGASSMIKDSMYSVFADGIMGKVDTAFALHNLPGYEFGTVLLKKGTFAAASKGVAIELKGETSHAAQPENGRSPAGAMASIIHNLEELAAKGRKRQLPQFKDFVLLTVVHAHLGTAEVAYGTTPGEGRVMVTVRTYLDEDMETLVEEVRQIVTRACESKNVTFDITFSDEFYATRNEDESTPTDKSVIELVRNAATETNLKTNDMTEPFRWSEDFGNFRFKGSTYFGIGAGKDYPSLHNDDYDFPDMLIGPSLSVFARLAEKLVITSDAQM